MTPLCDDTKATVANNSARGHADLMVPSALKAALGTRFAIRSQKWVRRSWGSKKVCQMLTLNRLTDIKIPVLTQRSVMHLQDYITITSVCTISLNVGGKFLDVLSDD